MEGYAIRQIAQQSGYSTRTIRRIVAQHLECPPELSTDLVSCRHVILDGTAFERRRGIFAVMDAASSSIVHAACGVMETPVDLVPFCASLADRGARLVGATIDGNPHLPAILRSYWPKIIIQRCLIHVRRQGLMWCRRFPKRTDAKHLRSLFWHLDSIETEMQRDSFLEQVNAWEKRYGSRIAEETERGWVASDLKRARSMLLGAAPHMFHYLRHRAIPKSTNALEGYFGRLKKLYRQHPGLSSHHRDAYLKWYLRLCPR